MGRVLGQVWCVRDVARVHVSYFQDGNFQDGYFQDGTFRMDGRRGMVCDGRGWIGTCEWRGRGMGHRVVGMENVEGVFRRWDGVWAVRVGQGRASSPIGLGRELG